MFMINRVKLGLLDQMHQMGKLERDCSPGFKSGLEPCREIVDLRYVSVDIVTDDQVGSSAFLSQVRAQGFTEEFAENRNPDFFRSISGTVGRLDTEAGDISPCEVPEEIAVVGTHLDNKAVGR